MRRIKLGIVDDHPIIRKGIAETIKSINDFELVCSCEDGDVLINEIPIYKPDIVLMDIRMQRIDGYAATSFIAKNFPTIKVIGFSADYDKPVVIKLLHCGAKAFLSKFSDKIDIVNAINDVHQYGYHLNYIVTMDLIEESKLQNLITCGHEKLNEGELQVLELLCRGYSTKDIADYLLIPIRRVDKHRENLLRKTKTKSPNGLVIYAIKHNLVKI